MTPTEQFLKALEAHGCKPKHNGKGWSALCPAHEDRNPSLSFSEGGNGRALVHCHAGCEPDTICNAIGLRLTDLMPDDPSRLSTSTESRHSRRKPPYRRQGTGKSQSKAYESADAAAKDLERNHGKSSARWIYHNVQGNPVGVISRWDTPDGKTFRPVSRHGGHWEISGMPKPMPLYGLPDLAGADRVFITEGEKAAEAARAIGLTATTSAQGSQSPDKTDWSPLAGKQCVILPDNDETGRKYAEKVAAILAKLAPPAVVKVIHLPDLPDHGDIVDWVEAQSDTDDDELRQQLEAMADEAQVSEAEQPAARNERFQPFPTDALPEPLRGIVEGGAKAIGGDTSYLAGPGLTTMATAIGNTRQIRLKSGWTEPAIIWTAIVGESGTSKTPALKTLMKPLLDRESRAFKRNADAMKQYDADLDQYDKDFSEWKRDKKTDLDPPSKPDPPQQDRYSTSDTTVEALAPILQENPRGILVERDELAGWLGSFDRYAGGKGADSAHWLSMHSGGSITVDRKTGNPRTIFVPRAAVSVTGGIQPRTLHRALGIEHRESGLAARLLLTCPPRKLRRWTEADIDPELDAAYARVLDRLYDLEAAVDGEGNSQPVVVDLTPEAKAAFIRFFNANGKEQADLSGDLAAAWSKLEAYAARFALVIHFVRWAANDPSLKDPDKVDRVSMEAGIKLAQWFKNETRRVYALLSESDDDRDERRLIEWIEHKGGSVTAREVQQGHRQYQTSQEAEAALDDLVKAGYGDWYDVPPGPKGGRPSRVFQLSTPSTSTKSMESCISAGCVDVDSVDTPDTQPDEEWGEV